MVPDEFHAEVDYHYTRMTEGHEVLETASFSKAHPAVFGLFQDLDADAGGCFTRAEMWEWAGQRYDEKESQGEGKGMIWLRTFLNTLDNRMDREGVWQPLDGIDNSAEARKLDTDGLTKIADAKDVIKEEFHKEAEAIFQRIAGRCRRISEAAWRKVQSEKEFQETWSKMDNDTTKTAK